MAGRVSGVGSGGRVPVPRFPPRRHDSAGAWNGNAHTHDRSQPRSGQRTLTPAPDPLTRPPQTNRSATTRGVTPA
jgi:hypothetical protein